ncbi:phosphorylase b kinase gamma catalytic chain, liver/testis isoform-like isoform X1 [Hypanus sabinus]|uniref:phosphorylase b kinase gamma catalytic chain, liver/testis isoform-like isoform X1 n=1 Tax=Hypanus sabinus TaxID=79690 RepID=UPI0028C4B5ED|nr:phosphorylase b kinase gamma catalytic chain, liver/testis isoform-like isoform X1 [Hypanus sabinus]XP_059809387.1 phosphorylase b kinase gamma catalytic chain, liver/testis isoform-like isoform X1 [Hypanus sabinus]XP_059809388.1 phosphorylase b kinase gamma catalytic chain, liver/testis isoform-like isoform X1 [Hypanus sabinus]XP_059809390.1 phosphorylase b kinase gamma catalytic chain, liver/testis isoform-like isoform X1 [Hypanus sabinus]XP_059809391.1 phosphorylase b kinase gamma catalyt
MTRNFSKEPLTVSGGFHKKYKTKEVIGRGVTSMVQRCIHQATGKEYAVKVIELFADNLTAAQLSEVRQSTLNEVQILQMVSGHRSIITLIDFFSSATVAFLVFDLMKQGELFDYLTKKVALKERETRVIMQELLQAVEYLHSRNVVHRDVKAENILLDEGFHIRLSDFGFSCFLQPGQRLRELCGTPSYLAPEILKCSMDETHPGYGMEVDMWACGVLMFTIVSGSPPFWHRKQLTMMRNIMEGRYQINSSEWRDRSHAIKDLTFRMLTVDPSLRITAEQALSHPFFYSYKLDERPFTSLQKFRAVVWAIVLCARLWESQRQRRPERQKELVQDAYQVRVGHRLIDGCAFHLYGHWVKRGLAQNRATLFQHTPRALAEEVHLSHDSSLQWPQGESDGSSNCVCPQGVCDETASLWREIHSVSDPGSV